MSKNRIGFYTIDTDYCDYLRKFDSKVPYTEPKQTRPFIGILLTVNENTYYAPLSSPKPKHLKMKDQIDFIKINSGKWGAINLNNMIPVHHSLATKVDPNHLQRTYNIQVYGNLLQNQLTWCNLNKSLIISKAEKLYYSVINNKCKIAQRCCDFSCLNKSVRNTLFSCHKLNNQFYQIKYRLFLQMDLHKEYNISLLPILAEGFFSSSVPQVGHLCR